MYKVLLILIGGLVSIVAIANRPSNENLPDDTISDVALREDSIQESEQEMREVKVIIGDETYTLQLENNQTATEFFNLLPKEFLMNELNGNEKFAYLDEPLTSNPYNPKQIEKGDVMLYGDNCLVIFYKSFATSYSYTKIGHLDNLEHIGNENITVKFEK